ncbi:MAG: tripartite tricarboxylate transporter substrate binding protein [Deltaproteobacteria bacterium]|nr:tripartite tricarboxylate transporter substrate binding protein [Deltaproteobacteria bacterium]
MGGCIMERKPLEKRAAILIFALFLTGVTVAPLCAQTYPSKPVRFILPFPAGGLTDVLGRIMAQKFADGLGQPVVPENRPGAGGTLGIEIAAKTRPDGYTIVLSAPAIAISPHLYKQLNFDPLKDLAPITLVAETPNVLCVRASLPVKNLADLVALAKATPGKLNYGTGGTGSSLHIAAELFKSLAKVHIVHVPYKGVTQAMVGMIGNEVDMVVIGIPTSLQHIQSGKVRALAVLSERRLPELPDVPTAREAGIDQFETSIWYGLMATGGTPRDIVNRWNAEWLKIVAMPDTREKMQKVGFEPLSSTPEQFGKFIRKETARYGKVIREANLTIE